MKRLLHLGNYDDEPYQHRLVGLTAGQQVAWKTRLSTPDTVAEIEMQARQHRLDGVVCSNQTFLEKLLRDQDDYIPPNTRKGITLDDYQGSLLFTKRDKLPVVIINPLANLLTQNYAAPAAQRFISKLSQPSKWFPQTKFTWVLAKPENIDEIYSQFLARVSLISIDIETIVDDPDRRIACVGFSGYCADTHSTITVVIPFTDLFFWAWVKKFCELKAPKIFQNGLYDNVYLLRWGIAVYNWIYDTQHLFHSLWSEFPKRLDFITAYSVRNVRYWKDDGKTGTLYDYYRYNAKDCWSTLNSFLALVSELPDYALTNYVQEFPLVFPCLTCEIEGVAVDPEQFAVTRAQTEQSIGTAEKIFQKMIAAPGFNVASPKQRLNLFKVLGLGHLGSTDKANMLKAKASSGFNERILTAMTDIVEDKKLISNYLVPEKIWNGRIHYKINPAGTDTGRLASTASSYWTGFQIQNIPRGVSVKQFIISDPGWVLCEIDKAQSEARCVGYLAGETKLIAVVEGPHDYHAWNAQAFFGVPYETIYDDKLHYTINKDLRDLSKRTNHGANYNMGARVMLDTMGPKYVSKAKILLRLQGRLIDVCQVLLDRYAFTYPKVKGDWYDSIVREIQQTGRLISPSGRTRIFFGKPWANKRDLNSAAAHAPQSLSVDLINEEFYNAWRCTIYGSFYKLDYKTGSRTHVTFDLRGIVRLKAQIHDSIFFQYRQGDSYKHIPEKFRDILMDSRIPIRAPDGIIREMFIPSDISAGKRRWSELK